MSLRWSSQEFEDWRLRRADHAAAAKTQAPKQAEAKQRANLKPGKKLKGGMNKWETEFAMQLEYRKQAGELVWWAFEPIRIRLANGAWYKPDFVTVDKQNRTEVYEVKGHWREAARVRFKVAVEKLPYRFYIVRKSGDQLVVTPV